MSRTLRLLLLTFSLIYLWFILDYFKLLINGLRGEVSDLPQEFDENRYEITFVTGYLDIGSVQNLWENDRQNSIYYEWMSAYGRLNSPMVIYSNDLVFLREATRARKKFSKITKLIYVPNMFDLRGFKYYNETKRLFESPDSPKLITITTNAKYSCVMHSKYDFMKMSIVNDYFKTPYFTWTDVSNMRYMRESNQVLNVTLPPQFNDSKIGFFEKFKMDVEASVSRVMSSYSPWVGGNFFIGKKLVMLMFINQYQQFVDKLIALKLMSTDENILYAMYTEEGHTPDMVDIQVYQGSSDSCDRWFHMMYLVTNHSCLRNKLF